MLTRMLAGFQLCMLMASVGVVAECQANVPRGGPRFGDTPMIRRWIKESDCPSSASRLPPVVANPRDAFTPTEACAVARYALEFWWRHRQNLKDASLRDTSGVTRIAVWHAASLIKAGRASTFVQNPTFDVVFERTPADRTIEVVIDHITGAATLAVGHPPAMFRSIPSSRRSVPDL